MTFHRKLAPRRRVDDSGAYPNSTRLNFDNKLVLTDARTLQLPADTPPGDYPIEFGVYGGPEGDRLMIRSADGHRSDERLPLTQIRVTPP